jgi:SHS2 domain-containing protein
MASGFMEIEGVTADAGIEAWGDTVEEAFKGAAEGLASLMADIPESKLTKTVPVTVRGENLPALLVLFLNELIFLEETGDLVPGRIKRLWINGNNLFAMVQCAPGAALDPSERSSVKAATYHDLGIDQSGGEVRIKVIFDV